MMLTDMNVRDRLVFNTVQIVTENATGTGFFFDLSNNEKRKIVLVTNKHVIENQSIGVITFHRKDAKGNIILEKYKEITLKNFSSRWIFHPDDSVDLCVFPMEETINNNPDIFFSSFDFGLLPSKKWREEITVLEDIIVVGYPSGLSDHYNNMPIVKKGTTATHINRKYQGNDKFVVDAGIYQGSSGSPVFWMLPFEHERSVLSHWFYLVGIICAVHTHTVEVTLPDGSQGVGNISNGLGIAINSIKLYDFQNLI